MTPILQTLHHCQVTCEHMTIMLSRGQDVHLRVRQLELLRDCADICAYTQKFVARHSSFAKVTANLCASVCEACANECLKFPDPDSQNCGRICLNCARECRVFAAV